MSSCPFPPTSLMQFQANINQFRELHWPKKKITTFYRVIILLILSLQVGILVDNITAMPRTKDHPLPSTSKSSWANHQTLAQVGLFGTLHAAARTGWECDMDTSREQRAPKQSSGTWPRPEEMGRAEGICSAAHCWESLWSNTVNGAEKKALETTVQKWDKRGNWVLQMWHWGIFRDIQNRSRMKAESWRSTNFQEDGNSFYIQGS